MSAIVRALSASKDNTIHSSNMKEEEPKKDKLEEFFDCENEENANISKDLIKEVNKNPVNDENDTNKQGDELEKDKGDESLSNLKPQVLGSIDPSTIDESQKAEVQILSLSVISPGRPDVVLPIPFPSTTSKTTLFTLKEGSKYRIKFHFTVSKNIVTGLKYTYMVWKAGVRVHQTKKMMGNYSPRQEPYIFELEEGTTPTGFFARGPFCVRSKFVDDDDKCYLDTTYYFDIRKDWGPRDK